MKERGITDGLTMNQLAERNAEHVATIAALEARYAALAAENAGLKAAIDSTIGWQQSTDPENVESVRMLVDIETPETDAFLAEVRASAIDSLVGIKTKQLANMHPDTHAFGATAMSIRSQINELQSFAAQLRKGAAL
ncbi:hypothetical protein R5S71_005046 [Salmonella enterica]|nr:hypothetical protein [Salmonella enterica subsp. enterica serovar Duisburg]EAQ9999116.1 hypothetical protein [Salmonella enterica]EAX8253030.1 hypothetical protein [Salmonella enterica]EEM8546810.1 hypothetical protein [Salmonella enterica]EHD2125577.1 hypothetical protein [Salmonella enterica]